MTKRKLNLDELKVESFVTSFESNQDVTVKGGIEAKRTHDTLLVICGMRATFMKPDTGGCQASDNGHCTTKTQTDPHPTLPGPSGF